ncbi:DUF6023 family protein [Actinoplanes sp. GCM10030250]|uniref:DUF6023 family protein n=1 Tax=Actinoplanes sp. GCM10030250 TaxID=3273376 RepID=UPI003623BD89
MNRRRGHGAVLYAVAALVLAGGTAWWWSAAPRASGDPRLLDWRQNAEQLLPDAGDQSVASTVAMGAGSGHEMIADIPGGNGTFLISVVCAGDSGSRVRVSLGGDESGRGVQCSGARTPEILSVALAGELHMRVNVDDVSPVVFRYTLQRMND